MDVRGFNPLSHIFQIKTVAARKCLQERQRQGVLSILLLNPTLLLHPGPVLLVVISDKCGSSETEYVEGVGCIGEWIATQMSWVQILVGDEKYLRQRRAVTEFVNTYHV